MSSIIEEVSALMVGSVEYAAPDEIKVLLEADAPQATALNTGRPSRFPRINGFVLIPNETGALVGLVSWLGVERSAFPKRPGLRDFGLVDLPFPLRRMSLNPVGTLRSQIVESGVVFRLERGVSVFPSVGDPVLLPTSEQLRAIVEAQGEDRRIAIGVSPLAANAAVSVDPDKLFGRHLAILGNTGSGKSCSVAGLIRWSLEAARENRGGTAPNARFIILDPNGEYLDAFSDLEESVRVFQAPPPREGARILTVPAWIWNSREWAAFAQAAPATQRPLLLQGLRNLRAGAVVGMSEAARLGRLLRGYRTLLNEKISTGPSAYSNFGQAKNCGTLLRNLVAGVSEYVGHVEDDEVLGALARTAGELADEHEYTWTGGIGFNDFSEPELINVRDTIEAVLAALPQVSEEAASEDAPLPFDPRDLADHLELLAANADVGQAAQFIATLTMRIRMMLADQRLGPIVAPEQQQPFDQWLESYVGADEASTGQITILDLSLIPSDVLHVVIAVIARVVFEATQRYRKLKGEELPTVLVLEEAHAFIERREAAEGATPGTHMCRETFEKIAREGRKFGLGLVLSSQRPSELSPTALAQCNTFLLHRIVNDRDQQLVGRLVPDNLGGLLRDLPNLPSRHAILLGWATPVPVLVEVKELELAQRPRSADPHFWDVWTGASRPIDWAAIASDWTGAAPANEAE